MKRFHLLLLIEMGALWNRWNSRPQVLMTIWSYLFFFLGNTMGKACHCCLSQWFFFLLCSLSWQSPMPPLAISHPKCWPNPKIFNFHALTMITRVCLCTCVWLNTCNHINYMYSLEGSPCLGRKSYVPLATQNMPRVCQNLSQKQNNPDGMCP